MEKGGSFNSGVLVMLYADNEYRATLPFYIPLFQKLQLAAEE